MSNMSSGERRSAAEAASTSGEPKANRSEEGLK
jgi:hypothetical protein